MWADEVKNVAGVTRIRVRPMHCPCYGVTSKVHRPLIHRL